MSQVIVSPSDLTGIVRAGNLGFNATDSGVGFNFGIIGSYIASEPLSVYPSTGQYITGARNSGTKYNISGAVDWLGLVTPIPDGAHITKVRMVCNVAWNLQANLSCDDVGSAYTGNAQVAGVIEVIPQSSIYAPSGFNNLSVNTVQNQSTPINSLNLIATAFTAGTIVDRTWDFTVIMPGGDAFISKDDLEANFTNVLIYCFGGAFANITWFKTSGILSATGSIANSASITSSLWEMIIDYDEPWTIISVLPDPAAEGDTVTITGTNLNLIPLSPDPTIQYVDDNGDTQTVTITDATLIDDEHITFTIPPPTGPPGAEPPFYPPIVTVFSGSVPITPLTIYVAVGTGIYRIVSGKTNDTLYDYATGSTRDVKIPDPFFETGFIGG